MAAVEQEPARTAEQIRAIPLRHWGRWVGAAVVLLLVAWLIQSALKANVIDFKEVRRYQFNRLILTGLKNTLIISVAAQAIGIVLGVAFAVGRLAKNPVLSTPRGWWTS